MGGGGSAANFGGSGGIADAVADENGFKVYGTGNLNEATMTIDQQYAEITEKYGLPKEKKPAGFQSLMDFHPAMNSNKKSVIKKAADRLSKPKNSDSRPVIKKDKRNADLLMDDGPPSSGYGTNESTSSTAKNGTPGTAGDLLNMFMSNPDKDEDPDEDFLKARSEQRAYEDALSGNNLLGMVEEPKARFGDADVREISRKYEENGSALMDFFVDPTQIFASERHPALQEVLKVLSKSKQHRGILKSLSLLLNYKRLFRASAGLKS